MSDLVVLNTVCLLTLNNIRVLLKDVLIDLHTRNFLHAKSSLSAHCTHPCHHAHNLLSPLYSSLLFFLRYCKDIKNLLFWLFGACFTMTSKNNTTNLQKTLMFIFMQKIIFISHFFLEILQTCCKLVILGTLDMPHPSIVIGLTCRCLSTNKKSSLKNPAT